MLFLLPLWTHALNIVDVLRSLVKFPIWVVSGRLFKLDLFDMTLKEKKKNTNAWTQRLLKFNLCMEFVDQELKIFILQS